MYISAECSLIAYERTQDQDGYDVLVEHKTDMFCSMTSVSHREYYEALQAGVKPVAVIVVNAWEYEEAWYNNYPPEKAIVNEHYYRIERAYRTDIDHYELTLTYDMKDEGN